VNVVRTFEPVMAVLGIIWLLLLVVDFTRGLTGALVWLNRAIWTLFVVDFAAEFTIAPDKRLYLKRHWIVAISLAVPAIRVVRLARIARLARAARAVRGARLVRTLASMNRAIGSLRATVRRRGAAYVAAMTALVTLGGAAGMYAFERGVPDPAGIHNYATALWWTAMIMTTMGSAYWPQTAEGRILCVVLALYAFAVFGYVTATLATYFVDRDAARDDASLAGERAIESLRAEIQALRQALGARPDEHRFGA
jgi:voltage-gated potassium channel